MSSPLEMPTRKTPVFVQGRYSRIVDKWSRSVWIEDPPIPKE
jgi:hypothetical protein